MWRMLHIGRLRVREWDRNTHPLRGCNQLKHLCIATKNGGCVAIPRSPRTEVQQERKEVSNLPLGGNRDLPPRPPVYRMLQRKVYDCDLPYYTQLVHSARWRNAGWCLGTQEGAVAPQEAGGPAPASFCWLLGQRPPPRAAAHRAAVAGSAAGGSAKLVDAYAMLALPASWSGLTDESCGGPSAKDMLYCRGLPGSRPLVCEGMG